MFDFLKIIISKIKPNKKPKLGEKIKTKLIRFVVDSPLQLINCIELSFKYKDHRIEFIVVNAVKGESLDQILEISNLYNIQLQLLDRSFSGLWRSFQKREKANILVLGDYRSFFQKLFFTMSPDADKILVDDGSITPEIMDRYLKKDPYRIDLDSKKKKFILATIQLLKGKNKKIINLFTIYDLEAAENQKNSKNNYREIKNNFQNKKNWHDVNPQILIIGSNYHYLGLEVEVVKRHYLKIAEKYKGKTIFYYAHRKVSEIYIKEINNIFEIKKNKFPIEIEFLINAELRPALILSTFSGALYTLKLIFNSVVCVYHPINLNKIDNRIQNEFLEYFEYIKEKSEVVIEAI